MCILFTYSGPFALFCFCLFLPSLSLIRSYLFDFRLEKKHVSKAKSVAARVQHQILVGGREGVVELRDGCASQLSVRVAGFAAGYPFDTVKTLMQHDANRYRTAPTTITTVLAEDGMRGFFRGSLVPMCGVGAVYAVCFLAYDTAERMWRVAHEMPPSAPLPLYVVAVCGGAAGVFTSFVQGPAELLKVRQQTAVGAGRDPSLRGVVRDVVHRGGLRGLLSGTGMTMCRDIPGNMIWFGVYEAVKRATCAANGRDDPAHPRAWQSLLSGGAAGVAMWACVMPIDTLKTAVQASTTTSYTVGTHSTRRSLVTTARDVVREVYRVRGWRGLYAGVGPAMLRALVATAVTFAARDKTVQLLEQQRELGQTLR